MVLVIALSSAVLFSQDHILRSEDHDLAYTYIEAAYVRSDIDAIDETLDGLAVNGSFRIDESFFVRAGASRISGDVGSSDIDVTSLEGLLGYRHELDHGLDAIVMAGIGWLEFDGGGVDNDDTGFLLSGGVRYRANRTWEFEGTIDLANFDDTELGGTATAFAHVTDAVSLFVSYGTIDDIDTLALGVRLGL